MEAILSDARASAATPVTVSWQGPVQGTTHKATFSKPIGAAHIRVEVQTFKWPETDPVRVEWARLNILAVLGDPNGRFRMPRELLPQGDSDLERQVRQEFNRHQPRRAS